MKKTVFCNSKKCIFFTAIFWLVFWFCISKMICRAWEGAPITFLNHSKWRRIEKDLPKCLVIGRWSMMGRFTLRDFRVVTNWEKPLKIQVTKHIQYNQTSLLIMNAHTLIMEHLLMKLDQKTHSWVCVLMHDRLWFSGQFCDVPKMVINDPKIQQALAKILQYIRNMKLKKIP
jgi:hypothetical protein